MTTRDYAPTTHVRSPVSYGLPLLWPFRGVFGTGLLFAGLLVIANMFAPQLVEHALPNWKAEYGTLVIVAVVLGFLRSILRLFIPVAALGFWIIAIFALSHLGTPIWSSLPSAPSFISHNAPTAPVVQNLPSTKPIVGSKALPDSAFFPSQSNQGLGALSKIPGVSTIVKWFK